MKIVNNSIKIVYPDTDEDWIREAKLIELAARNCYKSEDKITEDSWRSMIKMLVTRNHGAMIEFGNIVIHIICDRAIANEIVRHRICSFAQESTRYCNYSKDKFEKGITVVKPLQLNDMDYENWKDCCQMTEDNYLNLLANNKPEIARAVLPLSLKTELMLKTNWRELLHIIKLRTDDASHPDIRAIFRIIESACKESMPEVFGVRVE